MNARISCKQDTRLMLIEAGTEVMREKGYNNTGIQQVLSAVGVAKGSFYHHFNSKEDFALAIIDHFDKQYVEKALRALRDTSLTPMQRLFNYCVDGRQSMLSTQCRKGCLIGNLSQEMADQSETLRQALSQVMARRRDFFIACIDEGQNSGEINNGYEPKQLAELFLSGWEGAVTRCKTTKTFEAIDTFMDLMFKQVLRP
jgi:TetR/AcrR family transcriptional regulator, transcriptional repressor for nem operon